ncbi:MAG: general secretion pathway protein GspK [Bdellovibrionia bacterium]
MGLIQAFKKKLLEMAEEDIRRGNVVLERTRSESDTSQAETSQMAGAQNSKGIALLMVIAAVSTLSFLVTEFTYVAQLNQKLAYDELDQVKALYLAKSGFKLSLLRLKAYRTVKNLLANQGGGGASAVSPSDLDKIWSFPFMYPIPNIPGMSLGDKEAINKFQKESGFEGSYSAAITSESSRLNLNMILAGFQGAQPSPSPSPSKTPNDPSQGSNPNPNPNASASPSPSPSFDPEAARKSLQDYFQAILQNKFDADPDFQNEYRDFRLEDFMDTLVAWVDPTYERKQSGMGDHTYFKRGPFYSVTELHMLPGMDDQLFDLFSPNLTVSRTPGVNVNTIQEPVLRAMLPQLTDQEVTDFFKFRDDPEQDNHFKDSDSFFKYLSNSVAALKGDDAMNKLKEEFKKRNIQIVTEESEFKITIKATVNQSVRTLEAWVSLMDDSKSSANANKTQGNTPNPTPNASPSPNNTQSQAPDTGLRLNFMRIL